MLKWEDVAEYEHRPDLCAKSYRIIVLRKKISVEQGQEKLFEEYAYFFFITNDRTNNAEQIIFTANDRCDQENLIAQLKGGVGSMRNPLDNLHRRCGVADADTMLKDRQWMSGYGRPDSRWPCGGDEQ